MSWNSIIETSVSFKINVLSLNLRQDNLRLKKKIQILVLEDEGYQVVCQELFLIASGSF